MNKLRLSLLVVSIFNLIACGEGTPAAEEANTATVDTPAAPPATTDEMKATKKPKSYTSITEMIEDGGEYAADNNTFKIVSNNPLHIQISNIVMPSQSVEELKKTSMHAIVYVAYNAFASTNIKEITITSVPIIYDGATSKNLGFKEEARYTATIKKEKAQQLMLKRIGTSNFADLLGDGDFANSPSPAFDKLKSEDTIEEVLNELKQK